MYARRFPIRRGKLRVMDSLSQTALSGRGKSGGDVETWQIQMSCDLREMLQRQFYFFGTYFLEEHILGCWEAGAGGESRPRCRSECRNL
jgi:hypothetical protein